MRRTVPIRPLRGLAALGAALLLGLGAASGATAAVAPALSPALAPAAAPAFASALALSGAPALAPAGTQQQTFGIQPATASGPDSRNAYSYSATTGAQVKDYVAVWNYGDQPLKLSVYAADAFNTDTSGYDVLPADKPSVDVGAWVHLATETVTLPGRSRQIVPFTLAVPATAGPGDHSGGIVLALRRQTLDAKGNAVAVDQRVGARIHVRVAGALRPELTVESVHTAYHGTLNPFGSGSTTTSYTVRNTGNIRLAGRQAVRVRNVFGSVATADGPAALTELLPGNTATYSVSVSGVFPTLWSTASVTIDPQAVPGDVDPALPSATSSVKYATIPWTLLAIVLPLLALAALVWVQRRRNRRPGAGRPGGPGGFPPPHTPAGPTAPAAWPSDTAAPAPTGTQVPVPVPAPRTPEPASATVSAAAVPVPVPTVGSAAAVPVPVPVPAVGGAAAGEGSADGAAEAAAGDGGSKGAPGGAAAATAVLLLAGLVAFGGLTATAPRAYADPSAPGGASAAPATGPGTLAFDYVNGHVDDPIDVLTSGPCPHASDFMSADIKGAGFPAAGASVVGLSPASIFPLAANGGYVVPLSNSLLAIAHQNGVSSLRGGYEVDVFCKGRFLPAHFKDFSDTLTVAADGSWKAGGTAATVLIHGNAATPAPQRPAPSPALPTAAPAASAQGGGGMPSDSVAALVAGGGLLLLLGGSYLRRQREKVKAVRGKTPGATKAPADSATTAKAGTEKVTTANVTTAKVTAPAASAKAAKG
ncbi:hypothetical protein [Streptacidiphilus sp. EB129]|uniref:hypothetical protein n=1 Tax=Streptacidiphilus sp. EB129 TaxID=3156262 RepID=UPI0035140321